jgi:hypothetical protein
MRRDIPDVPHHTHIARYFDDYIDHFGFRDDITLNTTVEACRRTAEGTWEVTLEDGETRAYDALIVANGHHWDASWPDPPFPGSDTFAGRQMHSEEFVDAAPFAGQRVVVLGIGNSAMDISVESSYVAERVFLSARRGAYIVPNYLFGKPSDENLFSLSNHPRIPLKARFKALGKKIELQQGRPEDFGLPKPDHAFGEAHPTISNYILTRIAHGEVVPKPNIDRLEGDSVRFVDGTVERADVVVYCTGYRVSFPFFDESLLTPEENHFPLYRRVFKPEIPNVFFVGLTQPWGAIMPLSEFQAKWIASYLRGEYALPSAAEMRRQMDREAAQMAKRYVTSKRHTMQVEARDYTWELEREIARGKARALRNGLALPVEPRVAAGGGVPGAAG